MKRLLIAVAMLFFVSPNTEQLATADESTAALKAALKAVPNVATKPDAKPPAVLPEIARAQATLLHDAMHTTLQVTHDRFYREDEGLIIPAAAMMEVFADLKQRQGITLRWLVVEGQAMNTDHVAQNDFEEAAVKALKSGKPAHEQIDNGVFRRAAPITLSNHCLKCHVPDRKHTRDRTAGLIIEIPIKTNA